MMDIGIDLGTATVLVYIKGQGIVLSEPSAVAYDPEHGKVLRVGSAAFDMLGKTPGDIQVVLPLRDGVICDYVMAEEMVKYFIKKMVAGNIVKPRIAICVPSGITNVESNAVLSVAVAAGARKVYLIEEPVAAAIGAGIDISQCQGQLVVDIGGGTTDIAVLSLNGIVNKASIKDAGNRINEEIVRYVKAQHNLLIGEKMAEKAKIAIGSVYGESDSTFTVKGRDLLSGLPKRLELHSRELFPVLERHAQAVAATIRAVLEKTPPELVGDISSNGITMTGGGSLLGGLAQYIQDYTHITTRVADNPTECVAIGTGRSFEFLGTLFDGFVTTSTYSK